MVWFQCDDCGEDVKKPKLTSHFSCCSAYKLSCIDCGQTFRRYDAQFHTQCISEAEKYGPKNPNKPASSQAKVEKPKPNADVDINVGLSTRPPWFCSLCNTRTTSKQTLLSHADGKKHRAKAKAFHTSQKQSSGVEPSLDDKSVSGDKPVSDDGVKITESNGNDGAEDTSKPDAVQAGQSNGNDGAKDISNLDAGQTGRSKRKREEGDTEILDKSVKKQHAENGATGEATEDAPSSPSRSICNNDSNGASAAEKKIKWRKIIASTLESNPDGVMKIKKLQKLVFRTLKESGVTEDEEQLRDKIMKKISSSSRFLVDEKRIKLLTKT